MSTTEASRATLADVITTIQAADLAPQRRQDMASAVRIVARALGREPHQVLADPAAIGMLLSMMTAQQLGLSAGRWNNVRSLMRAALALVRPMMKGRSTTPMSMAWQRLHDALPTRADRVRLSRLMRWLSERQIGPDAVTVDDIVAFKAELLGDALLKDPEKTWNDHVFAWNRASGRTAGFPSFRIERPSRRQSFGLPWTAFPPSLKQDVDAWLDRLAGRDFADDGPSHPARASTLVTREYQLRAFASALVHRGRDPQTLRSLADLVTGNAFNDGLRFFFERRGGATTSGIHGLATMLKSVARHWVKVPDADLARMAATVKRLAVPQEGLTRKNRDRLRAFDDPRNVEALLGLPARLRDEVDRGKLPPGRAAVRAGLALAIELLLVAPVRRQNLADVAFSINRIINPALKSPQLSQFDQIVSAEAQGNKVVMKTKSPYPALMAQLVKLSIVPKAVVESVGDQQFNLKPVGSGPYRLDVWQKGVQTTLQANEAYWAGKPPFRTVVFRVVPDVATRVADLRTGRADIVRQLGPDEAAALKKEQQLRVLASPTERIGYMFINAQAGPTADVRVRRAIAHSIDQKTLIDALLQGYGNPVNIVLTPANFGFVADVQGYPYDLAKAKALVKEAGAEGATLSFLTSPAYDRRVVEALQQMVQETGLKVEIVALDHPTFLRRRQGRPDEAGSLSLGRWSCACQDADGVIFPLFRTGSIWAKYSNGAFDDAVDSARKVLDEKIRLDLYRKAFQILREDVPGIGIYQDYAIYGARKEVQWQPTPNEAFFVMDMKWMQ